MIPEIDKLRGLLDEAGIPYRNVIKKYPENACLIECEADVYCRNQVIYDPEGLDDLSVWPFDGIWQYGSYMKKGGLMETYGLLGSNEHGDPDVMDADEAFAIIKADWHTRSVKNG